MSENKYVPLSNRIKEDLRERLKMAAIRAKVSMTELLERFIESGLKNLESEKKNK